jgi:hypothetical protein
VDTTESPQKFRSTSYTSFSALGLAIVITVGALIIILGAAIEPLAGWVARRWRRGIYRWLEWNTNGTLQLQRLAHEAAGWGTWFATTDLVPIAFAGDILASLDLHNERHPTLLRRVAAQGHDDAILLRNRNDATARHAD